MARDVEANLRVNDRTGPGFTAAARRSERFAKEVDRTSMRIGASLGTAGLNAGISMGQNLTKSLARAAPAAGAALAGAAIYAAPLIGATLSGAIIGGAGIGGVVGGVMLAARDQRVQAAGRTLSDRFWTQMERGAESFIGPTLAAINDVQARMAKMDSVTTSIFSKSSRLLRPLVEGALNMAESVGRGIDKALDGAGPVIESFRRGLTLLGKGIEEVMASLSDDGISSATALDQVFNVLYSTVRGVGAAINALTEAYGFLAKSGLLGTEAAKQWILYEHAAKLAAASTDAAVPSFQRVQEAAAGAAAKVKSLEEAARDLRNNNLTLAEANTQLGSSLADAAEAARKNGQATSDNTAKGRANNTALQNLARSINAQREALEKVNGVAPVASKQAQDMRAKFVAAAISMGHGSQEAERLATKLLGIPKVTRVEARFDKAKAQQNVHNFVGSLAKIPRNITVQMRVNQINAALGPLRSLQSAGKYSADSGFRHAFAGANAGTHRTGGPTPVAMTADVGVYLDGAPFAAMTRVAVRSSEQRQNWRQRVGRR